MQSMRHGAGESESNKECGVWTLPSLGLQYLGGHLVTLTSQNANEAITQHLSTLLANLKIKAKVSKIKRKSSITFIIFSPAGSQ